MMKKTGLTPSKTVTTFDEDAALDPTFLNECSTAAFRFGHSQIANTVPCLNPDWEEQEDPVNLLQDNYFDPFLVDKHGPDGIVRGNVATHGMAVDTSFAEDIRNNLFKAFGSDEGGDLFAINIQRGREHGIGEVFCALISLVLLIQHLEGCIWPIMEKWKQPRQKKSLSILDRSCQIWRFS